MASVPGAVKHLVPFFGAGSRIKDTAIMQLYNDPDVVPSISLNQYPADMKADWSAIKRTLAPASEKENPHKRP